VRRTVWSDQAQADLAAIHAYIARDSERYAQLTVERIIESVDRLLAWPRSGRIVPEIGDENLREVLLAPYRIVYRLQGDVVGIATVVHTSREFHFPESAV
jgi:plasmid stabilization system protein ParE